MAGAQAEIDQLRKRVVELEASEGRYRALAEESGEASALLATLLDNVPDFVYFKDRDRRFLLASRAFEQLLGLGPSEIIGKRDEDVFPPEIAEQTRADDRRVIEDEVPVVNRVEGGEVTEGVERWVSTSKLPWRDSNGRVRGLFGISKDITEIKKDQDRLVESDRRMRQILDSLFGFVGICTVEGVLVEANRAPIEAAGLKPEDVLGKDDLWDTYWWNYDPVVQNRLRDVMSRAAAGELVRYEERVQVAEGALIDLDLSFGPLHAADGEISGIIGFGVDITERVRVARALRDSEERGRIALAASGQGTWELDLRTMSATYDAQHARMLGYRHDELRGHDRDEFATSLHPDDQESSWAAFEAHLGGDSQTYEVEFRLRTKSGGWKWILAAGAVVERDVDGRPLRMLGTHTDIDERKRFEARQELSATELRTARDRLRTTLNALPDLFFELDESDRIISFQSPGVEELYLPPEQFLGKRMVDVLPAEAADILARALAQVAEVGRLYGVQYSLPMPGGTRYFEASLASTAEHQGRGDRSVVVLVRDVSERWQAEQELREHARLQEVLVHEINHRVRNNLAAILGMLAIERGRAATTARSARAVIDDLDERIRSVAVVHDVLSENHWKPLPISLLCERVIQAAVSGHRRSLGATHVAVDTSTRMVSAKEAHHLALVMAELTTNALKHGRADDGTVHIEVDFEYEEARVIVRFRDRGAGFPAPVLAGERIAANLGLQLVEGITSQSLRGEIEFSNADGAVATIRLDD